MERAKFRAGYFMSAVPLHGKAREKERLILNVQKRRVEGKVAVQTDFIIIIF